MFNNLKSKIYFLNYGEEKPVLNTPGMIEAGSNDIYGIYGITMRIIRLLETEKTFILGLLWHDIFLQFDTIVFDIFRYNRNYKTKMCKNNTYTF